MNTHEKPCVCILAGGLSKRLRPITHTIPKPMVPIADKPFLQIQMEHFASLGFGRFVLAVSYLWEQIRDYFGDGSRFGWEVEYSVEPEPLGTGGAALWAQPLWGERAIVANGDTHLVGNWNKLIEAHDANTCDATISLVEKNDCRRYGRVEVQGEKVEKFLEKNNSPEPGWINAGVYLLTDKILDEKKRGDAFSIEKDIFPHRIGEIGVYFCKEQLFDIGTPESLEMFRKQFGKLKNQAKESKNE